MQQALQESKLKKKSLEQVLEEIKKKLDSLLVDKQAFGEIDKLEMKKRAYERVLLINKIEAQNEKIQGFRQEKQQLMGAREAIQQQRNNLLVQSV